MSGNGAELQISGMSLEKALGKASLMNKPFRRSTRNILVFIQPVNRMKLPKYLKEITSFPYNKVLANTVM